MPRSKPYPWNGWLDGEPRTFVRGSDFTCTPAHFQKQLQAQLRFYRTTRHRLADLTTRVDGNVVVMARVRKRVDTHDWDLLLDGERHDLVKGTDFFGDHEEFVRQARRAARKRGLRVVTRTRGNEFFRQVAIKAYPKDEL